MDDKSFEIILKKIKDFEFNEQFDVVVAVANGGIVPAALLNQKLGLDMQLLKIHFRNAAQQAEHSQPVLLEPIAFDPTNKTILLVEDRVKTGASLALAKSILLGEGAKLVKTFAVNGQADYCLFNETCFRFPWIIHV